DYYASWHGYDELDVLGAGPGSTITFTSGINPPGQPGTSDTRWLRDLEPLRMASAYLPLSMGLSFESNVDTFSHYGHLSNPAHSGNDWRICRDIADVTGVWSQPHDALDEPEIVGNPLAAAVQAPDGEFYFGGLLRDHHVPVEQWLPYNPQPQFVGASTPHGGGIFVNSADFWSRWVRWFDYAGYAYAQQQMHEYLAGNANCNPNLIPPNFYDLSNPDGSFGVMGIGGNEADELPMDEFVRGSSRWHIGRVLTDSDGDGFTDSFWFNVPGSGSEGTMQVVGVSVTDNGGRVNANAATQFIRSDDVNRYQTRTRGWTPADLALVGQDAGWDPDASYAGWEEESSSTLEAVRGRPWTHETWNVGLLDAPAHSTGLFDSERATGMPAFSSEYVNYGQQGLDAVDVPSLSQEGEAHPIWERGQFRDRRDDNGVGDFVSALGIRDNLTFPELYANDGWDDNPGIGTNRDIRRQINRLFYWQHAGSRPQDPAMGFTPFSVSDELELRMNEGNNQPWLLSRFERSLSTNAQHDSFNGGYYFRQLLRSASVREENGELSDQLSPRQLMHDTRRKLTLFNGARNEHLPPWLWWENRGNRLFAVSGLQHGRPLSPPVGLLGVVGAPETSTGRFDLLDEAWLGVPGSADSFGDVRGSGALAQFYDQMRLKLDLREHERFIPAQGLGTSVTGYRPRTFSERLPMALYLALTSGDL
ncbi:MAG: hypothetical protein MK095_10605, partial [Phycisphaerales bacterium]|nr:hypothetical protein [Phycisphaerales bacterium]